MPLRIAMRADANAQIGGGHWSRTLALGAALRARGHEVVLVAAAHGSTPWDLCEENGCTALAIDPAPEAADAQAFVAAVAQHFGGRADRVVVDHYGLGAEWERAVRASGARVLAIDDLADRDHACDWLLDQNAVRGGIAGARERYATRVDESCALLLGPRYALIRKGISELRRALTATLSSPPRVLVAMGAADPDASTLRIMRALQSLPHALHVDVVIGSVNPRRAAIELQAARDERFRCHVQPANYPALLFGADLAVGAGGVSSWERCVAGVPSVLLAIADNQIEPARGLAEEGGALYLGRAERVDESAIAGAVALLLGAAELRQSMAATAWHICDGGGVERVVTRLLADTEPVTLRAALETDAELMFEWRNHPATRAHLFDPHPLARAAHRAWLGERVHDDSCALLIGSDARQVPFGVLRYDLRHDKARISIYVDPTRLHAGLGRLLLLAGDAWLREHRPEVTQLEAEVLPGNTASEALFTSAGFALSHRVFRKGHP